MRNGKSGTKFEYEVRDVMKAKGFYVMRAAGSHGAADLIAWDTKDVLLIQCKKERKSNGAYPKDIAQLQGIPTPFGWKKQLWVKRVRKGVTVIDVENKIEVNILAD